MNVQEIVNLCLQNQIRLSVADGSLQIDAAKESLTDEIIHLLKSNKQSIIDFVEKISKQQEAVQKQKLKKSEKEGPAPLSFAQQRLWIIDQIEKGTSQYNMAACFMLDGELNRSAFRSCIDSIVERHEVLRANYVEKDGECFQVVQDFNGATIVEEDISHLDDSQQMTELLRLAKEDALTPFNLKEDQMLRVKLIKVSDESHCVLFNMHHIASDGWSIGVLVKEFETLYGAYCRGEANPLPPLEVQYADYAHWQRDWLQGEVLDQEIEFWKEQLDSLPVMHSLPLDFSRPLKQTFVGSDIKRTLNKETTAKINAFCREQGVTQFMALQTLYATALSIMSGEGDIVIGTPVAGRTHQNVEPLIGFFLNNLVLRSNIDSGNSVIEQMNANKDMILESFEHQHLPFDALVETLNPERSNSHQPLFQVWFVLQNHESSELELPGLKLHVPAELDGVSTTVNFDISLSAKEIEGELELHWQYQTELFEEKTAQRLADLFETLIDEAMTSPEKQLSELKVSQSKGLESYTPTQEWDFDKTIVDQFETTALSAPNENAISFDGKQLTFEQLNTKANRMANKLVEAGVTKGDLVGICLPRSLELLVAQLGIMKSGAAYVPLDPAAPSERLQHILNDTNVKVAVATDSTESHIGSLVDTTLNISGAEKGDWFPSVSDKFESVSNPEDLAYVLFTSGSTGKPKGVAIAHHSLSNLAYNMRDILAERGLSSHYRWAWSAPMMFDASVQAITQLAFGAQLFLLSDQDRKDPVSLVEFLESNQIDLMDSTPSLVDLLVKEAKRQSIQLPSLLVGGEAISSQLWDQLAHHMSQSNRFALNVYGPTECTVNSTFADIEAGNLPHLGQGLGNTHLYILNDQLQSLPAGAKGELYIGGDCLAVGYYNNSELTSERFIEHPEYGRLYKTGDLVRFRNDECLEFIGRADFQVKLRGYRIELGEIEEVLASHPQVEDSVVLVKEEQLTAYVVANGISKDNLIQRMEAALPSYMVAQQIHLLEEMPITRNGKQDRAALLAIEEENELELFVAPENETEVALQEIWEELLGQSPISVEANFFEIGGHSLLAIRLASACREKMGMELPLKELMENSTIRAISEQWRWFEAQKSILANQMNSANAEEEERLVI